uniref:Integron gene cassette protein n=1 Tax=Ascaris lumbricoides TaxID=6252 RepID=A0A0M3HV33_ASCLU
MSKKVGRRRRVWKSCAARVQVRPLCAILREGMALVACTLSERCDNECGIAFMTKFVPVKQFGGGNCSVDQYRMSREAATVYRHWFSPQKRAL